jgi:uncharacterized membrane protein HdeD (DUF308 family)
MSSENSVKDARRATGWSIALGVLMIIGGIVGLIYVGVATVTSLILFAWLFLAAGIVALIEAWQRRGRDGFWPSLLTGVLCIGAGIIIFWRPSQSLLALTMLAGVFFLVGGSFRIITGLFAGVAGGGWMVLQGVIDIFLAVLIIGDWPDSSYYVLGVLLSVSLLVDGMSIALVGSVAHKGLGRIPTFGSYGATPRHA